MSKPFYAIYYVNQQGNLVAHPRIYSHNEKKKVKKKIQKLKRKAQPGTIALFKKQFAEE
jgi:hypothetical protein